MTSREQLLENVLAVVAELESEQDVVEWLEEQLSIEGYYVDGQGMYRGAEILVSFGGPNIWVMTENNTVRGVWGGDSFERHYDDNIGLDDYMEECYGCL